MEKAKLIYKSINIIDVLERAISLPSIFFGVLSVLFPGKIVLFFLICFIVFILLFIIMFKDEKNASLVTSIVPKEETGKSIQLTLKASYHKYNPNHYVFIYYYDEDNSDCYLLAEGSLIENPVDLLSNAISPMNVIPIRFFDRYEKQISLNEEKILGFDTNKLHVCQHKIVLQ